ncbi:MAG: ABC transporter family protein [Candidatus Woesebacteria bacterium GW2011_GWB1_39_12]|uniref:ABC transporter family protein n=3 Tax=Candidatus Woeseibacteriota TaxID=1752722 RepID=A0A0G0MCL9_9BACT|nr:MAG: ABC transporter family protein [Candidatus Woesebacteria bacterium GW2011_GWB1_39_12]
MDQVKKYTLFMFIRDLAHYISPYRGQFFVGIFFRFTSDLARLYPAWAVSRIVLILSNQQSFEVPQDLISILVTWGLVTLYYGFAHNLSKYFGYQVAEKASLDIYKESLSHIFKLDLTWQEKENSGNKMKRIDKGLDGINVTIRRIFDVLIEVAVNIVGIVLIFFTLEKTLSLSLIFFIATYFAIGNYLLKRAVTQERIVNKAFEDLGGITFESLNNIQTIKALSIDKGMISIISRHITPLIQKIRRRVFLFQFRGGVLLMYEAIFEFVVIAVLAWGIVSGRSDISLLVLFIGLFQKVGTSTRELTDVTQQLALAKIWVSRTMTILRTEPDIELPAKVEAQVEYPQEWKEIKINKLKFAYKKNKTLKSISITIKRGEKIGIVGLSGAGKSTLFKLLLDLYEDYEGDISIDNISLKGMKRQSYINHVAVVLQDTELFDMTLKENIEIAAVDGVHLEPKLFHEAIRMAHLDDVVKQLPQGVNTIVGEKGIKLSGGQRQRVGIARALFRQPDILLLDEATSHLDAHSEKEIQKALQGFMHKFTTIVIAHRLSTIKAMDKIVVLDRGKVVERGSFDNLLNKHGVFAKMWEDQKI